MPDSAGAVLCGLRLRHQLFWIGPKSQSAMKMLNNLADTIMPQHKVEEGAMSGLFLLLRDPT